MLKYKIDWLAFSMKFKNSKQRLDTHLLEKLGYDFSEFEETKGRNFYSNGATYYNFLNVFWDKDERQKGNTMTIVFTGQGCTDLASKWENDWNTILKIIKNYEDCTINFTRLDIALDDFEERVKMSEIEKKLEKGHFLSRKEKHKIMKSKDKDTELVGQTIYIGNPRTDNGQKGNYYLRIYDKKAQYLDENTLLPDIAKEHWIRYEIVFSKKYANEVADFLINNEPVDKVFKTTLRRLLQLLTPRPKEPDKEKWYKWRKWEKFLEYDDEIKFELSDIDAKLPQVLTWLHDAVLPTLSLLEKIGDERGFDVYELLQNAKKPKKFSKKQNRLYLDSQIIEDEDLHKYLKNFLNGEEDG